MPDIVVVSLETVSSDRVDNVITLIQLSYGIPSLVLLILFLFVLGLSKDYQTSFYRLVQLDLLTNTLCYLNTWIGVRLAKHQTGVWILKSIEKTLPGILSWPGMFMNMFLHMQFCSSAALNIHRITSVVFFHKYERFWYRYYILYGIVSLVYSIGLSWPNRKATDVRIENGTLMVEYNWEYMGGLVVTNAVCSSAYCILILVLGLTTAFLVDKMIKSLNSQDRGVSRRLTKIALTYCSLYTGILLWSVITALDTFFPFLHKSIVAVEPTLLMFSSDMVTLSLPYILLAFDSNVRAHVVKVFGRKSLTGSSQVFVSSSSMAPVGR